MASGRANETFIFGPNFGQDTITGFLAGTAATHDLLEFNASAFGAGLTSANQSADLAALLSAPDPTHSKAWGTTNNASGFAVITDMNGDSLTLTGVSKLTLSLAPNAVDFKFV
jgi:hypothetical protein